MVVWTCHTAYVLYKVYLLNILSQISHKYKSNIRIIIDMIIYNIRTHYTMLSASVDTGHSHLEYTCLQNH